jgi:trehalose 6-phosphate synthase
VKCPIGFFLHTPWPAHNIISGVPHHRELIVAMLAYDLIGFQTDDDCENFASYLVSELGMTVTNGMVQSSFGLTRLAPFPIGIDVEGFAAQAARAVSHPEVSRLRKSLHDERLAIGVDRVDYSKGLVNRINAFDCLFEMRPEMKRTISLLQIATPSRGAIEAYGNLQNELAKLVTDVNGRHAEVDWTPIRYLNRGFSQTVLAGFYRAAQVAVVTPLHDGMNLVAKEYVAAQNPADPGVLVLSKFAGAANELTTALIVNPHDVESMARTIGMAFSMPAPERRMRWEAMMTKLRSGNIQQWFESFLATLESTHEIGNAAPEKPLPVEQSLGQSGAVLQLKTASSVLH